MLSSNVPATLKTIKTGLTQLSKTTALVTSQHLANKTAVAGRTDQFHASAKRDYPLAEPLPMPNNIDQSESTRFSPQRARDISSTIIDSHNVSVGGGGFHHESIDITVDQTTQQQQLDAHVGPYDCTGAVHLSSSMQSNVPTPFGGMHKFTHLNMPGGQWGQGIRLMANDMHSSHYTNLRKSVRENWSTYDDAVIRPTQQTKPGICLHRRSSSTNAAASGGGAAAAAVVLFQSHDALTNACREFLHVRHRMYSTKSPSSADEKKQPDEDATGKTTPDATTETAELTRGEKLKKAVKEYGSTVFVFHIGISLISLGSFYLLVSSGLDIVAIVERLGWANTALSSKLATGASTFVVAYAVHKVFAPVRISITLGATPFIVRYLRTKGILKPSTTK